MNKQFIISVVVLFFLTMIFGFFIHGMLLHADYSAMPNIMRPEEEAEGLFHYMILAHVLIAIGLTWIYRMGREDGKEWMGQGARFGIAIALVAQIPIFMIYYVVQQEPAMLVVKQIVFETAAMVLIGMATAFLNRS